MTISSTTRKVGPTPGNGVAVAYPFAFKVFAASDLLVVLAVTATGAETVLALTTDYTVALNADQNASPGGTVTMVVAPTALQTLTLTSAVPVTQGTHLVNGGNFLANNLEDVADRSTIQIQQIAEPPAAQRRLPVVPPQPQEARQQPQEARQQQQEARQQQPTQPPQQPPLHCPRC